MDGTVKLEVEKVREGIAFARVEFSGKVRSGSGINLPQTQISVRLPTPEDLRWIDFAVKESLDWVGVSFVRNAAEVQMIRRRLGTGLSAPMVMAKIEKREALNNLDAIIQAADGVMVARGDLGVETPLEQVPLEQKRIIAKAMELGRPVVTATQMLESMVEHSSPTRAEVTDVANAILDGTDAVMLSAETAIGQHPLKAVEVLGRIASATEEKYRYETIFKRLSPICESVRGGRQLCLSACWLFVRSGKSLSHRRRIYRFSAAVPPGAFPSEGADPRIGRGHGFPAPLQPGLERLHSAAQARSRSRRSPTAKGSSGPRRVTDRSHRNSGTTVASRFIPEKFKDLI